MNKCEECAHINDYMNYCRACSDSSYYESRDQLTDQQMNLLALIAMSTEEELKTLIDIAKENNKRCGNCKHDGESGDISGSTCYLCKRNPTDHRIDWWEEKK